MKLSYLWCGLLVAALAFSVGGCSKKPTKAEMQVQGGTIDLQKIYDLAHGTSPEVQTASAQLQSFIRYGQYEQALALLDKIQNDSSLNATQKQDVADLLTQVKQLAQNAAAQAPPK